VPISVPFRSGRRRPALAPQVILGTQDPANLDCPHCGRHQVLRPIGGNTGPAYLKIFQCLSCSDITVDAVLYEAVGRGPNVQSLKMRFYPTGNPGRRPLNFKYCTSEVRGSYEEACQLLSVHTGAAGAYARRSLELLLDVLGYEATSLAASIKLVNAEDDTDKRLPRHLRDRLDYIKEIGNFALHVRRDGELSMVTIDKDEVATCLDTIEELMRHPSNTT
jgi:hypothetical protein